MFFNPTCTCVLWATCPKNTSSASSAPLCTVQHAPQFTRLIEKVFPLDLRLIEAGRNTEGIVIRRDVKLKFQRDKMRRHDGNEAEMKR